MSDKPFDLREWLSSRAASFEAAWRWHWDQICRAPRERRRRSSISVQYWSFLAFSTGDAIADRSSGLGSDLLFLRWGISLHTMFDPCPRDGLVEPEERRLALLVLALVLVLPRLNRILPCRS